MKRRHRQLKLKGMKKSIAGRPIKKHEKQSGNLAAYFGAVFAK